MPLTTSQDILRRAQKGGYAVGAFNVENMEMAQAVVAAAEEAGAPVLLQATPATLKYGGLELHFAMMRALAERARVPVAAHLDHGDSFELVMRGLRAGYTSLMIDGSALPLEENAALTARVTAAASPSGIPVEAELGRVGGKEDGIVGGDGSCTDPEEAARFVRLTGVSSLAVSIGTAHGVYRGTPKLNVKRLREIRQVVDVPLVLHGASGLSDDAVRECIREGICKVNFATELRMAFTETLRRELAGDPELFDPKKYGAAARESVKRLVMARMEVCGCAGRC